MFFQDSYICLSDGTWVVELKFPMVVLEDFRFLESRSFTLDLDGNVEQRSVKDGYRYNDVFTKGLVWCVNRQELETSTVTGLDFKR